MNPKEMEIIIEPDSIVDPIGRYTGETYELAPRLGTLKGKTIGLLDNNKPNGEFVINEVEKYLLSKGVKDFIRELKPILTRPMPQDKIEKLAKADAIVCAIADCGSCTTSLVVDAGELEKRGKPTAIICTENFKKLVAASAEGIGIQDIPAVAMSISAVGGYPEKIVREKAKDILEDIMKMFTMSLKEVRTIYRADRWLQKVLE